MSAFVISLAAAGLNLIHRWLLLSTSPMTFDAWGHVYFTTEAKRPGVGPFGPIRPRVVGAEDFHYPLLVHWLYSYLPTRLLREQNQRINPVLESIFVCLVCFLFATAGLPTQVVGLTAILYILTPLWFSKLSTGPRVLNFTTRIFPEIAFPLALAIALFGGSHPLVAVSVSALLLACILLGSKFGVQTVVLVTPITAALALSYTLAGAWLLAFPVAVLLSAGKFQLQLRQQGAHLKWYLGELWAGRMPIAARNDLAFLFRWSRTLSTRDNLGRLIYSWFARNSFTAVLLKAPHVPLALIMFVFARARGIEIDRHIWAPVIAAAAVYMLINLKWLLWLGEAERYLSHVSIFTSLLFVVLCVALDVRPLIGLAATYGLVFTLAELSLLRGGLELGNPEAANQLIGYLKSLDGPRKIVVFPYHAMPPYRIMLETEHEPVFPLLSGATHKAAIKELENYPCLDLHRLDRLVELTGANLLILSSSERAKRLQDWSVPLDWRHVDLCLADFEIYERPASSGLGASNNGGKGMPRMNGLGAAI